jgi:hypothetical protein
MIKYIIAVDALLVYAEVSEKKARCLGGSLRVTRKNPYAIAVGSDQNMQHNYWYITWMAT